MLQEIFSQGQVRENFTDVIKHLVNENNLAPRNILAVTFTHKAVSSR